MYAPLQSLCVNGLDEVECSHMTDPLMQKDSSLDAPISNPVVTPRSDRTLFTSVVVALAFALFIRFFVAAPYVVSGSSMEPNFHDWNYLIVDRLSYDLSTPQRGDVIVLNLPEDTNRALIKRVVGLPGDTVTLSGPNPTITITNAANPKGFVLTEPYIDPSNFGGVSNTSYTLAPNDYFVMGDNRVVSADSRLWGILPRTDIVGRVLLRLYPFNAIGILPEEARYQTK